MPRVQFNENEINKRKKSEWKIALSKKIENHDYLYEFVCMNTSVSQEIFLKAKLLKANNKSLQWSWPAVQLTIEDATNQI